MVLLLAVESVLVAVRVVALLPRTTVGTGSKVTANSWRWQYVVVADPGVGYANGSGEAIAGGSGGGNITK
jgi:hypothetical protein